MFALDTNTLIYFFKGMGRVPERLLATAPSEVSIPTIVLYELKVGLAKSSSPDRRRSQLDDMLRLVRLLPFDRSAARASATIRTELENSGRPIGPMDTLIAGTVIAAGAILVSHNLKEFGRVPGLRVVDWF